MNRFVQDLKTYYKNGQSSQKIIFWNIVISVVYFLLQSYFYEGEKFVMNWFSLSSAEFGSFYKPWTYVTYAFLHADFFHILLNLIILYFSSKLFYTYFKNIQFLTVFYGGIIFAGLVYVLTSKLIGMENYLIGASAGVISVFFSVVTYNPSYEVRFPLIGSIKLWILGLFFILSFLIQIPTSNFGGHVAHFGGLFFGFIYTKLLINGKDLAVIPTKIFSIFSSGKNKKQTLKNTPFKKVYQNKAQVESNVTEQSNSFKNEKQKRIDDILDKISVSGYDSLAADEKDFLFRAGKE